MKNQVEICLGSSCFARGNREIVTYLKQVLPTSGPHKSKLIGSHCLGECERGPNIKINDKFYHYVTKEEVIQYLKNEINKDFDDDKKQGF